MTNTTDQSNNGELSPVDDVKRLHRSGSRSRVQWLLLIIFIASTGVLLAMWLAWDRGVIVVPGIDPSVENPPDQVGLFWVILAAATSLASLTGLVSTTILGWRKEQREARAEVLAKHRQELEIQKLELELARAKELADTPSTRVKTGGVDAIAPSTTNMERRTEELGETD